MYKHYFKMSKLGLQDKQLEVATYKSGLQTSFR
jgi:hypothetical protein